MPLPLNAAIALCYTFSSFHFLTTKIQVNIPSTYSYHKPDSVKPKIQVAILLDVSNSMDGLIIQAKDQLWNMVKVLGKVECNDIKPQIEIALYEYGRSSNDVMNGYIKKINSFITDLDKIQYNLQSLNTEGGDEFCAQVISTSIDSLSWDNSNNSYKVIFIAGNESFLQGNVTYTEACKKAKEKGIIVNTIFCGDKDRGIKEHWNLGAECGKGNYTNIDQNAKHINIPTPYDTTLLVLNKKLNKTLIPYGKISEFDTVASYDMKSIDKVIGYVVVRSDKNLYNRASWDLVDAIEKDSSIIQKIDREILPDSLQNKSHTYIKQLAKLKLLERKDISSEIKRVDVLRDLFIEKARLTTESPQTLQSEIEKIIRQQITRFNMKISLP